MRAVNLVGVMLVLCQLALPVSASALEISRAKVPDLVAYIYKDGVLLNNMLVRLDIKEACIPSPFWQISPWSFPNGIYYGDLPANGLYAARVQEFQFGTAESQLGDTYESCNIYFYFSEPSQKQIRLDIYPSSYISTPPCPFSPC